MRDNCRLALNVMKSNDIYIGVYYNMQIKSRVLKRDLVDPTSQQRYLVPNAHKNSGVTTDQINVDRAAMNFLIKSYCRESGVRHLQKQIEKVSVELHHCGLVGFIIIVGPSNSFEEW